MFYRLLIVVILFSFSAASAHAEGLVGTIRVDAEDKGDSVNFKDGDREPPQLKGQTAEVELRPPTWIEGKVFSNDDMRMYSYFLIHPFKKKWRWEIPNRKTSIDMRPGVVRHWQGYKPEGKCLVTCIPMGKGKFKFHHAARADGPHGYIERIGNTANGYPEYRFWYDDDKPAESTAKEEVKSESGSKPDSETENAKEY